MRLSIAFLVSILAVPALTFAAPTDCPKSFKNDDVCKADLVTLQTTDSSKCPFKINSGKLYSCYEQLKKLANDKKALCQAAYNKSSKTFSRSVGWLEVKENGEDKIPFISKCDPKYRTITIPGLSASAAKPDITPDERLKAAVESIDPTTDAGREQLAEVLQGTDSRVTAEMVEKDPQTSYDYLKAIADGDQAAAEKAAKELGVIPLNEDLGDVKELRANLPKAVSDNISDDQIDRQVVQNTFGDPIDASLPVPPPPPTPLGEQSANDQIRSTAQSLCRTYNINDCKQFENSMIATFYQECGGRANCMGHGRSYAGSFALSQQEYYKGIRAFSDSCDLDTDVCQYVQRNCSGEGRGDHLCNSAAATANHARIEAGVQAATSDPHQQAAIHMMYQLMPGQTTAALLSGDPSAIFTMRLSGNCGYTESSIWALCKNGVYLSPGATGADAINGIVSRYGTLRKGVEVATGIRDPGLGGMVPASGGGLLGSLGRSPFAGLFGGGGQGNPLAGLFGGGGFGSRPQNSSYYGSPMGNSIPTGQPPLSSPYGSGGTGTAGTTNPASAVSSNSGSANPATNSSLNTGAQQPLSAQAQALQDALQKAGSKGQPSGPPVEPMATIIAEQSTITRGNPIIISWSSVGMSNSKPCAVLLSTGDADRPIAQGNEGTMRIPTSASNPAGTWVFTLRCASYSGTDLVGQTVSVSVQ